MKPLLVGELNPHGADPAFALYPKPDHAAGGRLCYDILGMLGAEYLRTFDRVNLCTGKWDLASARAEALRLMQSRSGSPIILLGARVCRACLYDFEPFTHHKCINGPLVILPHPSSRCRLWNEVGAIQRARELVFGVLSEHPPAGGHEVGR